MIKGLLNKLPILWLTLFLSLVASSTALGSATIVIQNNDQPNVGFNDPTPVSPVGGNGGTTLGQQRLNAFQFAADIWGATLTSGPTITIQASWSTTMTCSATSAALGSAGATTSRANFANAPFPNTWYGIALANKLAGTDLNGAAAEINAQFNSRIGQTGCLQNSFWYLGLDGNHGNGVDLLTVVLHEFSHGLGFQTFTSSSTGVQASGLPSVYDRFLFDDTSGKSWIQMTNAERVASAINDNLVWTGSQVTSDVPGVLGATPRLRVNAPASIAGNYLVGTADFGPPLSSPGITNNVVLASPVDACSAITNGGAISGRIALVDRGTCNFTNKVKNVQNAGGLAVIIADNVAGTPPPGLGGSDPTITIPSVRITLDDGNTIKAQLGAGVNATLHLDPMTFAGADTSGRIKLYAPNPVSPGSSVSHFDTTALPNQLMEPNISDDLTHNVTPPNDLTFSLLTDVGWTLAGGPPPSPTPTPSPPFNDNFVNAQVVSGCSGSVNGSNVGATAELGEPNHSPDTPGGTRSVWYQWQSPGSGSVTVTTAGSDFDTVLAVYTGTAVNGLTLLGKNDDVVSGTEVTSTVTFTATAGTIYRIAVDGYNNGGSGGDVGSITFNWSLSGCTNTWVPTTLTANQVELKSWTISGQTSIYVKLIFPNAGHRVTNWGTPSRVGNDFTVDAAVERFNGVSAQVITNTAQIYDLGALAVGNYTFTFKTSGTTAKTLNFSVSASPPPANPIDDAREFVRWQYKDFLRREPDGPGWDHWTGEITMCSDPANRRPGETEAQCVERKRENTSAAFFVSPEFQNTGYFVLRVYRGSLGRMPHFGGSSPPDPVKDEFTRDAGTVSQGIVVNNALDPAVINANKQAFVNEFVTRAEFRAIYDGLSNAQYVDRLFQTTGVTPTGTERQALIDGLGNSTETKASVVFKVVDGTTTITGGALVFNSTYGKAFYDNLFNAAFVQMEYFGYLLRDPDDGGYTFWLGKLNTYGDWVNAEMVKAFIKSPEYRSRFGAP